MRNLLLIGLVAGLAFAFSGCASSHEIHFIKQIPRLDSESSASVTTEKSSRRGENSETGDSKTTAKSRSHSGAWLARFVRRTEDGRGGQNRKLKAIEIIFCPADRGTDFTKCRVGVGWSKDRPRLGKEVKEEGSRSRSKRSRSRRSRK